MLFGTRCEGVVVCTTRLIAIRRIDLLIEAMARLASRGRTLGLILVGDGPEREKLETLSRTRQVPVHFEGACYDETRIAELVGCSNVAVAPGKVGLTAIHAMGYGVPVISNDAADTQMPEWEAIIPGKTGAYFKAGDVESLAQAIEQWLDPGRQEFARKACLELLERFWNPEYQRRAIERAVLGLEADDLFDAKDGPKSTLPA